MNIDIRKQFFQLCVLTMLLISCEFLNILFSLFELNRAVVVVLIRIVDF